MERKKVKRKTDPDLLRIVNKEKCCIEGCVLRAQAAHIKSRGARGDDDPTNLCPLCWKHHSEQHTVGWKSFKAKHPEAKSFADLHKQYHPCWACTQNGLGEGPDCTEAFEEGLRRCPHKREVAE